MRAGYVAADLRSLRGPRSGDSDQRLLQHPHHLSPLPGARQHDHQSLPPLFRLGKVQSSKTVQLKIPAGVETGSRLRVREEGEEGSSGGPSGDLYVFITVEPHNLFERNGNDIHCRVPITFVQAALGDVVEVPTLRGRESLKIPPGTQSGSRFCLRGKGIASLHGDGYGDQVIETVVTVPTNLTRRQEELLKEFERLENEKRRP